MEWLVVSSAAADVEPKLRLETALEDLGVTPEDRKKILAAQKK